MEESRDSNPLLKRGHMSQSSIYFPCLAMMGLTICVMVRMFLVRVKAVKEKHISIGYFKTYNSHPTPPSLMIQADRNFVNLFEVPTLFYMVCAFTLITNHVDSITIFAAWLYVFLRCVHSFIHTTTNKINHRMLTFTLSCVVLIFMAVRLACKLI